MTPQLSIYRRKYESATSNFNMKKTKDFCIAIAKTWELGHIDVLSPRVQYKLREDIYISFSAIIWIIVHKIEKVSERIEILDFLKQQAPDLWFGNGAKQKLESYLYRYFPQLYIHLRYLHAIICRKVI